MTRPAPDVDSLRSRAEFFVSQRRKDVELYALLADCLALCEAANRGHVDAGKLRERALAEISVGSDGRRYFESDPDIYLVVGRLVFERTTNRAACWRYTATLRAAAERQIPSTDLAEWLRSSGGVNALFRSRPVASRTAKTRTLHLNAAVTVPKTGRFTLVLDRDARGFFDVVQAP